MHFTAKQAAKSSSFARNLLLKTGAWMAICVFTLLSGSCNYNMDRDKDIHTNHKLDSLRVVADNIADTNVMLGIRIFDSAFRRYRLRNSLDSFEYYYFLHDKLLRLKENEYAESYIDSMLDLVEEPANAKMMASDHAKVEFIRADHLFEEKNYNEAYEHYYKAKLLAGNSKDSCALGYYDYKLAITLYRAKKFSESIIYYKNAIRLMDKCRSDAPYFFRVQEIMDDIGLSFFNLNNYDSALYYYQSALKYLNNGQPSFSGDKAGTFDKCRAVIYGNMGSVYEKKGNQLIAEKYYDTSIKINSAPGFDTTDALYTQIKLARLYLTMGLNNKSKQLLYSVAGHINNNKNISLRLRWYDAIWQLEQKLGHQKEAVDYLGEYTALQDSITDISTQLQHVDLGQRVNSLEKQRRINVLEKKNELRGVYIAIAVLICLLSIAIVLLALQNARKSRKNLKILTTLNAQMVDQQHKLKSVLTALEKHDKEKDRILKAVSHDMRSPINSALALAELVSLDISNFTEEQKEFLDLIKKSCNHALLLTTDLMEIATLHTEQIAFKQESITSLVRATIELLRFRAANKNQIIELNLPEEDIVLNVNAEKIGRVVNNLVTNSIKFSPPGSTIIVTLGLNESGVLITVHDNGIGIPENLKTKVFEIFTEAKRFGTSGEEPTGLGLSISKQIVEAHGGKIWFSSIPQKETDFYIYLPLVDNE